MQRELVEAIVKSGVRLSFRAHVLLLLIFDALQDEPLRGVRDESEVRRSLMNDIQAYLPEILQKLQKSLPGIESSEAITVFDILHNFEPIMGGLPRNQFFPGKL